MMRALRGHVEKGPPQGLAAVTQAAGSGGPRSGSGQGWSHMFEVIGIKTSHEVIE